MRVRRRSQGWGGASLGSRRTKLLKSIENCARGGRFSVADRLTVIRGAHTSKKIEVSLQRAANAKQFLEEAGLSDDATIAQVDGRILLWTDVPFVTGSSAVGPDIFRRSLTTILGALTTGSQCCPRHCCFAGDRCDAMARCDHRSVRSASCGHRPVRPVRRNSWRRSDLDDCATFVSTSY